MEADMQTFTLPRETFNLLVEALGGQQKAEVFAKSMESFLVAIDNKAAAGIVDKKEMLKIEVREELRKELVTRELFDGLLKEMRERFNVVDEKFNGVNEKFRVVDERFKSLEDRMDEKFKGLNFKLNLFFAIALIALTFANPAFVELIKKIF
jgi:predicted nuclease with TOPRIM domain